MIDTVNRATCSNGCYAGISSIYLIQGKKDSAYIELQKEKQPEWKTTQLIMLYYSLGKKAESDAALQKFIAKYQGDWAYQIAQNFAWKGVRNQVFYWLEHAYINRDAGLAEIKGNPFFKNVESDPRYTAFMKKIGLL